MALRLETDKAFIGNKKLELKNLSSPMSDGTTHLIEVTASLTNHYQTKISMTDLKGVLGEMIPMGLDFLIYEAQGKMPGLSNVSFQNLSFGRCIRLTIYLPFKDWSHRLNLMHFANDFCFSVENKLAICQSASAEKSEYGMSIFIRLMLNEKEDCFEVFNKADEDCFLIYKQLLSQTEINIKKNEKTSSKAHESGYRWWLQYVVVPLVSALGAVMVGWVLSHL